MSQIRFGLEQRIGQLFPKLGRDGTEAVDQRTCLVLAPHPDDETLGCGAYMARKVERGASVWVGIASLGGDSHASSQISEEKLNFIRQNEVIEACRRLGVKPGQVAFLMEKNRLVSQLDRLKERVSALVDQVQPDEVFVTSALDDHADHLALNRAVADLAAEGKIRADIYEYPVWFWLDERRWRRWIKWNLATALRMDRTRYHLHRFRPLLISTRGYLEKKRYALSAHASQMTRLVSDEPWATLGDIEGGRFLECFFQQYELFFPHIAGSTPPPQLPQPD